MNRLTVIAFSSLTVLGTLGGCASSTKSSQPSYNQTNTLQTNKTSNTTTQTPLSSSSNDTNSSNGTNSSAPLNGSGLQFSNYVVQAMGQVKQATKVPFLFAPTEPTFHPNAPFVSVGEYASDWDYSVNLYSTSTSVPMNDASLEQLPASANIGMFGGT